jgi:chaperone required for assembly of F1-ATPase
MKKFYHLVAVNHHQDGYVILLDGKILKTKSGRELLCSNSELAHAIMAEWVAQKDEIKPETMPLTQIMVTLLDKIQEEREVIHVELMNYLDTDLVCYRADGPPSYVAAQKAAWDPVLQWFESSFGTKLETTTAIAALTQSEVTHQSVETYVRNLSDEEFVILQIVTAETGSLILALAFLERAITPDDTFRAAQVEELLKSEIHHEDFYGKAPDVEKKQKLQLLGLEAARVFLDKITT